MFSAYCPDSASCHARGQRRTFCRAHPRASLKGPYSIPHDHRSLEKHTAVRFSASCHALCWELGEACHAFFLEFLASCHSASGLGFSASCHAFCFRLTAMLEPAVTFFVSIDIMSLERVRLLDFVALSASCLVFCVLELTAIIQPAVALCVWITKILRSSIGQLLCRLCAWNHDVTRPRQQIGT